MKIQTTILAGLGGLLAAASLSQATLITETFNPTANTANEIAVPDGSSVGIANSLTVSDPGGAAIEDVSVNLNISGGYNGDLYGYLVFQPTGGGSASLEVLLNQIGTSGSNPFGDSGPGMNVTLSDSGTGGDIHSQTGSSALSGSYTPDSTSTLDSTFTGSADGTWTLFLADLSAGGGTSELVSWGVGISVGPEPVTWALLIFATLGLTLRLIYSLKLKTQARVSQNK